MAEGRLSSLFLRGNVVSKDFCVRIYQRYYKLGLPGKAFVWFLVFLHVTVLGVFFFFGPKRIFQWMYNAAQQVRNMPYGWLILFVIAVIICFPPLIGHTTVNSICGFAFGMKGFLIALPAAIIGSSLAFLLLRALFRRRVKTWTKRSKKWQAMEQVIMADGLPLIILIRLCPIPWVYSNALFASIESVRLWQFIFATICFSPKILLATFIGSQVAELSDGTHRANLSTGAQIFDIFSVVLSFGIAFGTGWHIWRMTERRIGHMEGFLGETNHLAADAEGASALLLQSFSSASLPLSDEPEGVIDLTEFHTTKVNIDEQV